MRFKEIKIETIKTDEKIMAVGNIASQVAHDIRSPLAALNAIVKQTCHIPEKQRIMLRDAARQINDIANNLLEAYRLEKQELTAQTSELMVLLLDTVVSEKRAQYSESKINIAFNVALEAQGLFCQLIAADFKRVVSNIINNSVEAIQKEGNIIISLSVYEGRVKISIADDGAGMAQALVEKIMEGKAVSNKKSGHGIGLASAKKIIENWGGNLTIVSQLGKGTIVNIILPKARAPVWFAAQLNFIQNGHLIILDDDQSIHDVWESRIESEIPQVQLKLVHYYSPEALLNAALDSYENAVYLCDYELLGHSLSGLDVIEKLKLRHAVLVTSRYDEADIRHRCQKINIKILPKSYAIYVPFIIETTAKKNTEVFLEALPINTLTADLILIDDNKTLTESWAMWAALAGKNLVIFNSLADADAVIDQYSFDTPIYIDSDLGEDIKGELYAKTLYEKGHHTIYLTTGYDASRFDLQKLYWIKKVVNKEPPEDLSIFN